MAIYVGVNGVPKEIGSLYVGANNAPTEVSEVYVGSKGSVEQVYSSGPEPGETVFTSSGTFTVPKGVTSIDVFCVGGGGGGGVYLSGYIDVGGAGGGYTKQQIGYSVSSSQSISVIVGSGASDYSNRKGSTSSISIGSTVICTADGGYGGSHDFYSERYTNRAGKGGYGGSGGGSSDGTSKSNSISTSIKNSPGNGGYDGGNGGASAYTDTGGIGQATTTRYFGESDGTLYAGGGGGGACYSYVASYPYTIYCATPGTGGAGGGGNGSYANFTKGDLSYPQRMGGGYGSTNTGGGGGGGTQNTCGGGGSGIAVIRWGK